MKVRPLYPLAAAAGLWLAGGLSAAEPVRSVLSPTKSASADQKLADTVARTLRESGRLHSYNVGVRCQNGGVELQGSVLNLAQRQQVLALVQNVDGVKSVSDRITVADQQGGITQVDVTMPGPIPGAPVVSAPLAAGPVGYDPGAVGSDPVPVNAPASANPYDQSAPKMPSHAWPTYAPHNNYSRVAYPEKYPYNAWPFIGPFYPYPKVPLGWRKIYLEWEDGHWYYGRAGQPVQWWQLRYW